MDKIRSLLSKSDKGKRKAKDGEPEKSRFVGRGGARRIVTNSDRRQAVLERETINTESDTRRIRIRTSDVPPFSTPISQGPYEDHDINDFQTNRPRERLVTESSYESFEEEDDDDDSDDVDVEVEDTEMTQEEMEEEMAEEPVYQNVRFSKSTRRGAASSSSGAASKGKKKEGSWMLTTGIEGGPLNPDLLIGFLGHVAYKIWQGEERGPLSSPNRMKLLRSWDLHTIREDAHDLIIKAGFAILFSMTHEFIDMNLISAFIERWHPETNSFHMPFGEMTITLHDVAYLLGIPIDGEAIYATRESLSDLLPTAADFLNMDPATLKASKVEWRSGALKFTTIKNTVTARNVDAHKYATGYLMFLLGATLFTDKTENTVKTQFLPLLLDLAEVPKLSWGSAALAFLYRQMGIASRSTCKEIGGYLTLLQAWIYAYFPRFAPPVREGWTSTLSHACKWMTFEVYKSQAALLQFRRQLDACREADVKWTPFRRLPGEKKPISLYSGIIHCREIKEPYMPERVLRQFGYAQTVPRRPIEPTDVYLGENIRKYMRKFGADPAQFGRASLTLLNPSSFTFEAFGVSMVREYMTWYLQRTHPKIHNGEGAVTQQLEDYEDVRKRTVGILERMHPQNYGGPWDPDDLEDSMTSLCSMWEHMFVGRRPDDDDGGLNL